MNKLYIFLLLAFPCICFAQSDEINISASFAQSIELRITAGASTQWTFTTINHYKKGFAPYDRHVKFEVASSVNFSVQFELTDMTNASGDLLDLGNFSIRPALEQEDKAMLGSRVTFGDGYTNAYEDKIQYLIRGDVFRGDGGVQTLFNSGPEGNAGGFEDNPLMLIIGLGYHGQTKAWGMKNMLDQNITPGTYTGTMTLTAIPVAL
ncbi:MAG: hypothetical protein AAFR66_11175 [Bacteroidota bacterium]